MANKPRNEISKEDYNVMHPIDVTKLGTEDDPCFGKHYDLTTDECQRCGDSEFCSIKMAQTAHLKRKQIESKQEFKDLQEKKPNATGEDKVTEYMRKLKAKGLSSIRIKRKTEKQFELTKAEAKKLYNQIFK